MTWTKRTTKMTFEELDKRIPPRYYPGDESGIFIITSEGFRSEKDPRYRGRYYETKCRFCEESSVKRQELLVRGEVEGSYCPACRRAYKPVRGPGVKLLGEPGEGPSYRNLYPVGFVAGPFEVIEVLPAGKSWAYKTKCQHCKTVTTKTAAAIKDAHRRNYVVCGRCRRVLGSSVVKELYLQISLNRIKVPLYHEEFADFDKEVLKLAMSGRWGIEPPVTFGVKCWYGG